MKGKSKKSEAKLYPLELPLKNSSIRNIYMTQYKQEGKVYIQAASYNLIRTIVNQFTAKVINCIHKAFLPGESNVKVGVSMSSLLENEVPGLSEHIGPIEPVLKPTMKIRGWSANQFRKTIDVYIDHLNGHSNKTQGIIKLTRDHRSKRDPKRANIWEWIQIQAQIITLLILTKGFDIAILMGNKTLMISHIRTLIDTFSCDYIFSIPFLQQLFEQKWNHLTETKPPSKRFTNPKVISLQPEEIMKPHQKKTKKKTKRKTKANNKQSSKYKQKKTLEDEDSPLYQQLDVVDYDIAEVPSTTQYKTKYSNNTTNRRTKHKGSRTNTSTRSRTKQANKVQNTEISSYNEMVQELHKNKKRRSSKRPKLSKLEDESRASIESFHEPSRRGTRARQEKQVSYGKRGRFLTSASS